MDDATLVEAARSGDEAAWARIYDRYADRLHDHCHRLLRDRDEAADALHDAFIAAARNLHQLRDPSRLRPWLYSICRHEALRRVRRRARVELTDEVDEMRAVEVDLDRGTSAAELQELVWAAAAGLGERDQALLDLNLRQGLEGQDLADAMGVSLSASYVLMSRLRDQVERALGALLIARLGRDDCDELGALLAGWDGHFTPLLRKRVARHVDRCETCSSRRAAVLSPAALLAAAPVVPAPAELRGRVLEALTGDAAGAPVAFDDRGFAAAVGTKRWRWHARVGVAASVVLALALALGIAATSGDGPSVDGELAAVDDTTTTTDGEARPITTAPPTDDAATSSSTSAISSEEASAPEPGEVAPPPVPPQASPPTSGLPAAAPPTAAPDRSAPSITSVVSSAAEVQTSCNPGNSTATIEASVADAGGLASVVLVWSGGPGSGSAPMVRAGAVHRASLPTVPFDDPGTLTYRVVATDVAGNRAQSAPATIEVLPCPG